MRISKDFDYNGYELGYDIDCHISFKIESEPDTKKRVLLNMGISPNMKGFAFLTNDHTPICFLKSIAVEESERGFGYGTELLDICISEAKYYKTPIVLLADTYIEQSDDFDLVKFYESKGFIFIEKTTYCDENEIESSSIPTMILI